MISRRDKRAPGKDKMNIIALSYELTGTCQENEHCRKERTILVSPVGCKNQLKLDLTGTVFVREKPGPDPYVSGRKNLWPNY